MTSTGGKSAPFSFVMSPTCIMPGSRSLVTSTGNGSISLAHIGRMPHRCAASGKPPIPSNRLPMVNSFVLKMHLQNKNANRTSSWLVENMF